MCWCKAGLTAKSPLEGLGGGRGKESEGGSLSAAAESTELQCKPCTHSCSLFPSPPAEVSNRWPGFYEGAIHAAINTWSILHHTLLLPPLPAHLQMSATAGPASTRAPSAHPFTFGRPSITPSSCPPCPPAEVSNRWPGFYEGAIHAANVAVANMTRMTLPTGVYRGRFATYREPSIKPHKANRRQMS